MIAVYTFAQLQRGMSHEIRHPLTLSDIESFSRMTGDFHPLHCDRDYAVAHGFRDVIAHGLLVSSFASTLIGMHLPGENTLVMSQKFQYPSPAYPGDTLTIRGEVQQLDERFLTVEIGVRITNQEDVLVSKGTFAIKMRG